jgi:D-alanine transaminase
MEALANCNGQHLPLAEVKISALDRGFLLGDAVYEVLRVYQGRPWLVNEHFRRLERSLQAIRLSGIDLDRLRRRMRETIAAGPFSEATVYIQITRGAAPRSHAFPAQSAPLELLYVKPFADPYVETRQTGAQVVTHPDLRWQRCDIKSTNLLANVLAMQSAREAGCVEALLYRSDGTVTEGTHSSLFGVMAGEILTTPQTTDILPGITRELAVRLAGEAGIPVRQRVLQRAELVNVDELFLTGTTAEVLPVVRVDGSPVRKGIPGPVTRSLQDAFQRAVRDFLASPQASD